MTSDVVSLKMSPKLRRTSQVEGYNFKSSITNGIEKNARQNNSMFIKVLKALVL